jgi:hypothetical protein
VKEPAAFKAYEAKIDLQLKASLLRRGWLRLISFCSPYLWGLDRLPSSGYNIAMTTLLYARQSPKRDTLKRTVVVRLLPRRGRG